MAIYECRVRLTGGAGSGPFYNIFHVDGPDPASAADAADLVTPFKTFYTSIKAYYGNDINIYIFDRVLTVDTPPQIVTPAEEIVEGTDATGHAAPQVAAVVSWATAFAGAAYRGRTYLGPLSDSAVAGNGQIATAVASTMGDAASQLMSDLNAAGGESPYRLGVYSRVHETFTPYSSATVHPVSRTQRRRN